MVSGAVVNVEVTGGSTVTLNWQSVVLPLGSVAVNSTNVVPAGNVVPLACPAVGVTVTEQLSVAVGVVYVTTGLQVDISAGQNVNTGNSLSVTVTLKVHVTLFPLASAAVNVTTVVPIGNAEPLGNPDVWDTIVPGQLSVAAGAAQLTTAEQFPASLITFMLPGQEVNTGFSLSVTVTVNEHKLVFPAASLAVNTMLFTPIGNAEPLANPVVCTTETPGQLSLAMGAIQFTTALQSPGVFATVMLTGHDVNTGTSLSTTVTVNEQTAVLPLASVAVNEILVTPNGKAEPLAGPPDWITTTPAQLSVAAGAAHVTTAVQFPASLFTTRLAGQEVNTGISLSVTVILKEQTEEFPLASVAVNETLVVPIGKTDPLEGPEVCTILTPAQLSVAAGAAQVTMAEQLPGVLFTTWLAGQTVNTGASLSVTLTVNAHMLKLPLASVAVNETLVTPMGKVDPLVKPAVCVIINPGQLSLATGAAQLTTAPHTPGLLFTEIFIGHEVNTGNWLSVTVTTNEQVAVFPPASVAVKVTLVMPTGKTDPLGKPAVWEITVPGQLSVATGATHDTVVPHAPGVLFTLIFTGHEVNVGAWLSVTVTVKEHTEVFPKMSEAVNVTTVAPIGNADPLGKPAVWLIITAPGQLSEAAGGAHDTTELHNPGVLFTAMFEGQEVNVGASLSVTVTVNEQITESPAASVAVNEILVVPNGKTDPLGKPAVCVINNPGQLSVAAGATHDTNAEQFPGSLLTVIFTGHETKTGAWLSTTVTANTQLVEFPLASVAV
jgi:hypothetical protein